MLELQSASRDQLECPFCVALPDKETYLIHTPFFKIVKQSGSEGDPRTYGCCQKLDRNCFLIEIERQLARQRRNRSKHPPSRMGYTCISIYEL